MPFDVMTSLGLVNYPINYGQGLVLKGDHAALIPFRDTEACDVVQWHFVQSVDDHSPLSWDVINNHCNMGDVFHTSRWEDFADKRAIVGYFPKAELHLGTESSARIQRSQAIIDYKRRLNMSNELTPCLGTSGLGVFGGGVSGKITFTRRSDHRIQGAHTMFWNKLKNSTSEPSLLYDADSQRGWLVPTANVILQLALTWASHEEDPGVLAAFHTAAVSSNGEAAYRAIEESMVNELPRALDEADFDKSMKVRDVIKSMKERIGQIIEQQQQQQLGRGFRIPSDGLTGYEFVDIASFKENMIAKRACINGSRTGGWLKVVENWPDIPVILWGNLGEPIRPAENGSICHQWTTVPENGSVLAASATCLEHLSAESGGDDTLKVYPEHYRISPFETGFEVSCPKKAYPCCSPFFEINGTKPKVPFRLDRDSALMFGKPPKLPHHESDDQIGILSSLKRRLNYGPVSSRKRKSVGRDVFPGLNQPCNNPAQIPLVLAHASSEIPEIPSLPKTNTNSFCNIKHQTTQTPAAEELSSGPNLSRPNGNSRDLPPSAPSDPDELRETLHGVSEEPSAPRYLPDLFSRVSSSQRNDGVRACPGGWQEPRLLKNLEALSIHGNGRKAHVVPHAMDTEDQAWSMS